MITLGRRVYGLGAIALGIVELAYGAFASVWLPVPTHLPAYHAVAYACAGLLILGGLAVNLPRTAGIGALGLATFFAASLLVVYAPHVLGKPADWGLWQAVAESAAMAAGGVLAYGLTPGVGPTRANGMARVVVGVCLLVFGGSHFVYAKFTASLVPAWLPPSQLFWAYATGVAQVAAGLAVLAGVQARLAAALLTAMYVIFGLLVHIPSVIAAPSSHDAWAENAINLLLIGAAWGLADSLAPSRMRP